MEVDLIAYTPDPIMVIYTACRTCYSAQKPHDIFTSLILDRNVTEDKMMELINSVVLSHHDSVLEHINFTFTISGISRSCSHQLVRHRHMSVSQQSQRYVAIQDEVESAVPRPIEVNPEALYQFEEAMVEATNHYHRLIKEGVKAEDARAVLPNAAATNMVITLNLREMIHICGVRLCQHAQKEIRDLVTMMRREIIREVPSFTPFLVPECAQLGYCPQEREPKGCLYPTREKMLQIYKDHQDEYKDLK